MSCKFDETFDTLVANEMQALSDLKEYFDGTPPYAGARFHSIGKNEPNRINCDDMCAVSLLGIRFESRTIYELADESFRKSASDLLEKIPESNIWDTSNFESVNTLWAQLREIHGIRDTIAGKFLARKRPRLIPIYDTVVAGLMQAPAGMYWESFRMTLQDKRRIETLEKLRTCAGLPEAVSLLRIFDVIAWMEGKRRQGPRSKIKSMG